MNKIVAKHVPGEANKFKISIENQLPDLTSADIKLICLDCGKRFSSDSILWATLDYYSQPDEALCPGCENNNLGRDDSPKDESAALNFIVNTCDDLLNK